jgi:hypothetical protein
MAKIRRIVFFLEDHFNERDYKRFGIEILERNGFDVEVWEFSLFLATNEYKDTTPPDREGIAKWEKYRDFSNRKNACDSILSMDSTCFVVSFVRLTFKSLPLYWTLKKRRIPYGVFLFALLIDRTFAGKANNLRRRSRKMLKPLRIIDYAMKKWLEKEMPLQFLAIKPADIIFAQAEKYLMPNAYPANSQSDVLFAHSFDYDIYLGEKNVAVSTDEKLGIFLDEYLPFHADYDFTGDNNRVYEEEYYPKLREFFNYLESTYGVKIVIAAHPRSDYENHPDYYGGRQIIRGKTVELVKKAGFIILHNSTALNYAVLFQKPMVFITTNDVNRSLIDPPSIECLAGYFNKKSYNLDEDEGRNVDLEKELQVDVERYKTYKNEYIKKDGTEELLFWQIVANRIKQWGEERC